MAEQRPERANSYQTTLCPSPRGAGIPHMASFTSFPTNSSSGACGESFPNFDALQLYTQLCRRCEESGPE